MRSAWEASGISAYFYTKYHNMHVSHLLQVFSVSVSVLRHHIHLSFPEHLPTSSKILPVHFDATSPELQSYGAGHLQSDPSQSRSACLVWCLAVVPFGTSWWLSPPLAHSQHPSESNVWIRLREESILFTGNMHHQNCATVSLASCPGLCCFGCTNSSYNWKRHRPGNIFCANKYWHAEATYTVASFSSFCKRSKTGGVEGLGTRLEATCHRA